MNDEPELTEGVPEEQMPVGQPEPETSSPAEIDESVSRAALQEPVREVEEEPAAAVRQSRLGRFLRRALRWITSIVVVFGIGFMANQFAQVEPLRQQSEDLQGELAIAQAERDQLQSEVAELEGVRDRNQDLEDQLQQVGAQLDLLSVLVDVTAAQLAIAQDDPVAAKAALADTDAHLVELGRKLGAEEVAGLRERLALVVEEVDADIFAAQRDLEILANTVIGIQRERFGAD